MRGHSLKIHQRHGATDAQQPPSHTLMRTLLAVDGVSLTHSDDLFCLRMDRGQNVINPDMVSALDQALAQVEEAEHPKSLVILGGPKFFSNGLDVCRSAARICRAALGGGHLLLTHSGPAADRSRG